MSRAIIISILIAFATLMVTGLTIMLCYPAYRDTVEYGWAALNLATAGLCGVALYSSRAAMRQTRENIMRRFIDVDLLHNWQRFNKRVMVLLYIAGGWNLVWGLLNLFHFFR